jgi:hypothetical protein
MEEVDDKVTYQNASERWTSVPRKVEKLLSMKMK